MERENWKLARQEKPVIVECSVCRSRVDAEMTAQREHVSDPFPYRVSLLVCPSCHETIVGLQEAYPDPESREPGWSTTSRLWPDPERVVPWHVPSIVRHSLEEAGKCLHAGAFAACAVMCGRALEGICIHHKTQHKTLARGLAELREREVIDKRLSSWAESLRELRNLGAHASDERVSPDDARDLLDFAHAITDYVFVLTKKFEDFTQRRAAGNGNARHAG